MHQKYLDRAAGGLFYTVTAANAALQAYFPFYVYQKRQTVTESVPIQFLAVGGASAYSINRLQKIYNQEVDFILGKSFVSYSFPEIKKGELFDFAQNAARDLGLKQVRLFKGMDFYVQLLPGKKTNVVLYTPFLRTKRLRLLSKAIIAHELAHASNRDAISESLLKQLTDMFITGGAMALVSNQKAAALSIWGGAFITHLIHRKFDRESELRADKIAARYVDPKTVEEALEYTLYDEKTPISIVEKIVSIGKDLLATHPRIQKRLETLAKARIEEAQ